MSSIFSCVIDNRRARSAFAWAINFCISRSDGVGKLGASVPFLYTSVGEGKKVGAALVFITGLLLLDSTVACISAGVNVISFELSPFELFAGDSTLFGASWSTQAESNKIKHNKPARPVNFSDKVIYSFHDQIENSLLHRRGKERLGSAIVYF